MFRIIFDPRGGKFKVQLLKWGCIWVTVQEHCVDDASPHECYIDRTFGNYDLARQWVRTIGLDRAYREQASHVAWAQGGVQ
jgi:hypothetical protein